MKEREDAQREDVQREKGPRPGRPALGRSVQAVCRRSWWACLTGLLLLCAGCSSLYTAERISLMKTEGDVGVVNSRGRELTPVPEMKLYNGYAMSTEKESFAWLNLDSVKLAKLDEDSKISISKRRKAMEVTVDAGSLYFNIKEPLDEDETLDIRTSNMAVGIRGTCGWVEVLDAQHSVLYLLEGTVGCTAGDKTETVTAGEKAEVTAGGEIEVSPFTAAEIPAFVATELKDDADLQEKIRDASGIDVVADPRIAYADVLDGIDGEILFAEPVDFEGDGDPELLVLYVYPVADQGRAPVCGFVCRRGPEGISFLSDRSVEVLSSYVHDGSISLAQAGEQLVLLVHTIENNEGDGIVATSEHTTCYGVTEDGNGWTGVERLWHSREVIPEGDLISHYSRQIDPNNGAYDINSDGTQELSQEGYEALLESYPVVRTLVIYTPDNVHAVAADAQPAGEMDLAGEQAGELDGAAGTDLYGDYIRDVLEPRYGRGDVSSFSYGFERFDSGWGDSWYARPVTAPLADGIVGTCQRDLDKDGSDELLMFYLEGSTGSGAGQNNLGLKVYSDREGSVTEVGGMLFEDCFSQSNDETYRIGLKDLGGYQLIYAEGNSRVYTYADGAAPQIRLYRYDGSTVDQLYNVSTAGSDGTWWSEWEQDLKGFGFMLPSGAQWGDIGLSGEPDFEMLFYGSSQTVDNGYFQAGDTQQFLLDQGQVQGGIYGPGDPILEQMP